MSALARMAGIQEGGIGDKRLIQAISMGKDNMQQLVAIANGAPPKNGVDSMYATIALNILGPALKAQKAQQAGQQPKSPTVKDQVVAQASDMGGGITNLPAETVMTEQAMAAGGIVAFQGGGGVGTENITKQMQNLIEERKQLQRTLGFGARGYNPQAARLQAIERELAYLENQFKTVAGREAAFKQTRLTDAPFAELAPTAAAQQPAAGAGPEAPPTPGVGAGPEAPPPPPAGPSLYKSQTSFPAIDKAAQALQSAYKGAGEIKPEAFYQNASWEGMENLRPVTADQIRAQRLQGNYDLQAMYPQSLEAAKQQEAERSAGLEGLFKQREKRAAEMEKAATVEKGQTAGIGLMQIAQELVTKPLNKIDMTNAFQTFKDANKDFRQAKKDVAAARDKIDEARELDRMGQHDRARKEYREGVTALLARRDQTDVMANAADAADKAGLRDIASMRFQNTWKQFDANVSGLKSTVETELAKAGIVSAERRTAMQSAAEVDKYKMLQPQKANQEMDRARDNALSRAKTYMEINKTLALSNPNLFDTLYKQYFTEELKALRYTDEQINKLLGAGSSAPTGQKTLKFGEIQ